MDNANDDLSNHLDEVLDDIDASDYVRMKYRENAMLHEITFRLANQFYDKTYNKITRYQVGSTYEGTTTPGLNADTDFLHCYETRLVIDNLVESKQQGRSYLILTDEDLKPGYVRLQIVKDKCPLKVGMCDFLEDSELKIDQKGRLCMTHQAFIIGQNSTRNGPADTLPAGNGTNPIDFVYACRCRKIPRCANFWIHKKRTNDWPSQKQLRAMVSYGCFLVGVGHPHSDNKSMEWRISFTLQERYLMSSLNETQHKCYILLKMIKKYIIEPNAGESISSYHLKTSLFYTIENSKKHNWNADNLIRCAMCCLKRVLIWVKANNCPNYFIPEENMFDKLSQKTLETVEKALNTLSCDNLGKLLKFETRTISRARHLVIHSITVRTYSVRNSFFERMRLSFDTITVDMHELMQIMLYLLNANHITEHTTRVVRIAFDSIIPHIQLQYQQCIFAQYLSRVSLSCMPSKTIPNVISGTSDCDLISSKLSLASLCIQFVQFEEVCKSILVSCEDSLKPYVLSMCGCNDRGFHTNPAIAEKLQFTDMSSLDFKRNCTTGCMVFIPSQVGLVHAALLYELFRNVYTESGSEVEDTGDYWLNWITVDSQVYLYFLQYLLYSKNKKKADKTTAMMKLMHVLITDSNLGHEETALNLCGWICLQENDLQNASMLLCKSWKIRPFRNAAKWHMLILLSEIIKRK